MPRFLSYDGTELAYRLVGEGPPLVCLPGGPGRASEYLGDLGGGIPGHALVILDNRGTGESARPRDTESYRMERIVEDVEALGRHLDLTRLTLLGHSSAGNVLLLYARQYPRRLSRLVFVGPSTRVVDIRVDDFMPALQRRGNEDWHPSASPR
jgi:pimeloyl-ACP methyl ester carboxylesterase